MLTQGHIHTDDLGTHSFLTCRVYGIFFVPSKAPLIVPHVAFNQTSYTFSSVMRKDVCMTFEIDQLTITNTNSNQDV